jgi:hypothetical protein
VAIATAGLPQTELLISERDRRIIEAVAGIMIFQPKIMFSCARNAGSSTQDAFPATPDAVDRYRYSRASRNLRAG